MYAGRVITVFLSGLMWLSASAALADGSSDEKKSPDSRPTWKPVRSTTQPAPGSSTSARSSASSTSNSTVARPTTTERSAARLEQPLVVTPQTSPTTVSPIAPSYASPGAVYLNGSHATLGPDGLCSDPACPTCRARYGVAGGHAPGGVIWPPIFGGFWVRPEVLMWTTQGAEIPALVTSGGTGVLGQPGTTVVFGNDEINDDWRLGGRIHAGIWLNQCQTTGIEGNVFALKEETTTYQATNTAGGAVLARPFFNIQTPAEDARLIPAAGFTSGSISIAANTELQGGELMLRQMIGSPRRFPTALLVGYRYMRLDDDLRIDESQTGAPGPTSVTLFDSFDTENTFHGLNLGVISEMRFNRWTGELVAKLALGNTHSTVEINGATTTTVAGVPTTTVGGLLAQSTNIGTFEQDDFSVIPELGATLGFNITERLKATAGYTFIYWSRVARAGDQIDRDLNLPLVPGPTTLRPEFAFRMTDFWAHGLNVGLEYAY